MGDHRSIPITPIIFSFFSLLSFSFKAKRLWDQSPQAHSFCLNFSHNFLTYQRGCVFNPNSPHFIFLLYFSPNSLIYSRGYGFNPHSPQFIFLLYFSHNSLIHSRGCGFESPQPHLILIYIFSLPSHSAMRLWVQIPHTSFF